MAQGFVLSGWKEIIVSLHGGDASSHDYIVDKPGSFERVERSLENVSHFKRLHGSSTPLLGFHVVLTRRIYREIYKIIEMAKRYGVSQVGIFPMHNAPYETHVKDLEMSAEDDRRYQELVPGYRKLLESYGIGHDFQLRYQEKEKGALRPERENPPAAVREQPLPLSGGEKAGMDGVLSRLPCYYPWYHAAISAFGFISPCCYGEGKQTKGDLRPESFQETWFGYDMEEVRRTMLQGRLMPYCQNCPNWYQDDNNRLRAIFSNARS